MLCPYTIYFDGYERIVNCNLLWTYKCFKPDENVCKYILLIFKLVYLRYKQLSEMSFNNFIRVSNMEVSSCCQFGGLIRNQNGFRASVMTSYAWSLVLILYNAPAKSAMYLLHDRYFRFTNPPVFVHSSVIPFFVDLS